MKETVRERLFPYLAGAVHNEGGNAIIVGGTVDHIHILARLHQRKSIADYLRDIKANSSGWIHDTFPDHESFAWQQGYGAFSVSKSQLEKVRKYIETQEVHHRRTTFEDEFIALLKAHGVPFDPRYVFE